MRGALLIGQLAWCIYTSTVETFDQLIEYLGSHQDTILTPVVCQLVEPSVSSIAGIFIYFVKGSSSSPLPGDEAKKQLCDDEFHFLSN